MKQEKRQVAELILDQLKLFGVKRIYGVVGDTIIGLIDAIAEQNDIQFIAVKHESAAAFMASAEAKLTGRLAVCTATMGPGATNLLNGLGDAYADRAPVLAITGQAPRSKIGTEFQQYIDQQELMKPFAAYSANLASQDAIIDLMHKAAQTSLGQRAVSHISIPKDLFNMTTDAAPRLLPAVIEGVSTFEPNSLEQAVHIMQSAQQPMILAGAGAMEVSEEIKELSELWGAGILTSLGGKGLIDASFPNLLGGIGEGGNPHAPEVFKEADVVLMIGATWWPEGYVPKNARIIQIDKNLQNVEKSIPTELGIAGEAGEVLPQLKKRLSTFSANTEWLARCHEVRDRWEAQNEQEGSQSGSPVHPARIARALERTVAEDAILTLDTGDLTVWMNRNFRPSGQSVLFSGYWRTLGFGLPAAIAAKLEQPEKQVIAVVGDGGLQMTLADLLTATRYGLNITVVLFNNGSLQMERDKIKAADEKEVGVELTNPDFVKVAEACGWQGFRVESDTELEAALEKAFLANQPTFVDVYTEQAFFPETK